LRLVDLTPPSPSASLPSHATILRDDGGQAIANFESDDEILDWIAKHSEAEFRQNVEHHTFGNGRLENARVYLDRIDGQRAGIREERAILATEQAAGAALNQAETARQALRISKWALGIAIVSAFVTVVGLLSGK
jgi:hypothetical protein